MTIDDKAMRSFAIAQDEKSGSLAIIWGDTLMCPSD